MSLPSVALELLLQTSTTGILSLLPASAQTFCGWTKSQKDFVQEVPTITLGTIDLTESQKQICNKDIHDHQKVP